MRDKGINYSIFDNAPFTSLPEIAHAYMRKMGYGEQPFIVKTCIHFAESGAKICRSTSIRTIRADSSLFLNSEPTPNELVFLFPSYQDLEKIHPATRKTNMLYNMF